jgi:hypothetical protein
LTAHCPADHVSPLRGNGGRCWHCLHDAVTAYAGRDSSHECRLRADECDGSVTRPPCGHEDANRGRRWRRTNWQTADDDTGDSGLNKIRRGDSRLPVDPLPMTGSESAASCQFESDALSAPKSDGSPLACKRSDSSRGSARTAITGQVQGFTSKAAEQTGMSSGTSPSRPAS